MTDSILIIESDPVLRSELISVSSEANFAVKAVRSYSEALLKLNEFKPDLIIIDAVLPGRDGVDACYQLHSTFVIPVVLFGENYSDEMWERVIEADADCYLVKPFGYLELVARAKAILRRYKTKEKMSK